MMLRNPIQLRLAKLKSWQQIAFMVCMCERMYPNYGAFCEATDFAQPQWYRCVLDVVWETLTVKNAKVNFDTQLKKLEDFVPRVQDFDVYGVYPAVDACIALGELLHACLNGENLEHAVKVSQISMSTVASFEMTLTGEEIPEDRLKIHPAIVEEWDSQWEIFHLLKQDDERNVEMLKGLRFDLRDAGISNIGIKFEQKKAKK